MDWPAPVAPPTRPEVENQTPTKTRNFTLTQNITSHPQKFRFPGGGDARKPRKAQAGQPGGARGNTHVALAQGARPWHDPGDLSSGGEIHSRTPAPEAVLSGLSRTKGVRAFFRSLLFKYSEITSHSSPHRPKSWVFDASGPQLRHLLPAWGTRRWAIHHHRGMMGRCAT